jgi:hypothetical protein
MRQLTDEGEAEGLLKLSEISSALFLPRLSQSLPMPSVILEKQHRRR